MLKVYYGPNRNDLYLLNGNYVENGNYYLPVNEKGEPLHYQTKEPLTFLSNVEDPGDKDYNEILEPFHTWADPCSK